MKTLREYNAIAKTVGDHAEGITWGPAFPAPIHGTVNGLPVRAITIGDLPGASDVLLCADEAGNLVPVKRTDFVNTDGAYLPLRTEAPTAASMR
jgi:hypothetical protein